MYLEFMRSYRVKGGQIRFGSNCKGFSWGLSESGWKWWCSRRGSSIVVVLVKVVEAVAAAVVAAEAVAGNSGSSSGPWQRQCLMVASALLVGILWLVASIQRNWRFPKRSPRTAAELNQPTSKRTGAAINCSDGHLNS